MRYTKWRKCRLTQIIIKVSITYLNERCLHLSIQCTRTHISRSHSLPRTLQYIAADVYETISMNFERRMHKIWLTWICLCRCLCDYYDDVPVSAHFVCVFFKFISNMRVCLTYNSKSVCCLRRCHRHRCSRCCDKHVKICLTLLSTKAQAIHETNSVVFNTHTQQTHSNKTQKTDCAMAWQMKMENHLKHTHAFK